ncbi:MAG: hypothetical protein CMJ58_21795 [Planctomycetaceae bacterium]|nr:hypothetical protein [Planctomycetaceae bacterium]
MVSFASSTTRSLPATALCCAVMALLGSAARGGVVHYAPIALTGERGAAAGYGPDLGEGVYFSAFRTTPVLNQSGEVAFRSALSGPGVDESNDVGVWKTSDGTLQLVAREGAAGPGPGLGPNVFFTATSYHSGFSDDPILNSAGVVLFPASLTGDGVSPDNDYGRWTDAGGILTPVARQGSDAFGPRLGDGVFFTYPGGPAFNSQGHAAFISGLTGAGVDATNDEGIWLYEDGALTTIARTGVAGPGPALEPGDYFVALDSPILNDVSTVVFKGQVAGAGVDASNDRGLWTYQNGVLTPRVREGDAGSLGPNLGPGFTFSALYSADINASGEIVFDGRAVDTSDGSQVPGIWLDSDANRTQIIGLGDAVAGSGLQPGTTVASMALPLLNAYGDVAFRGTIAGPGVASPTDRGIFTNAGGELVMLAREYDAELGPGTDDGAEFYSFSNVMFNAQGDVAFTAELTVELRQHDYNRGDGIWATKDGVIHEIIRVGDYFDADPGPGVDMQQVLLFDFLDWDTSAGGNGRKLHFTDDGLIAFAVVLENGAGGVYTAQIVSDDPLSGDFDADGDVDATDFFAWQQAPSIGSLDQWKTAYGATAAAVYSAAVPEPTGHILLLGSFLVALMVRARSPGFSLLPALSASITNPGGRKRSPARDFTSAAGGVVSISCLSARSHWLAVRAAVVLLAAAPLPVHADDFEWSLPLDGFFISAGPWTRLTGTSSPPPGSGDLAIFNEAGAYTATFTNNRTTEDLQIDAGDVTFRSSGTDRTYSLTGDAVLDGGDLVLGVAGDALDLNVGNVLRVRDGSRLDIEHGSDVAVTGQLRVGAHSSGDGTVVVNGSTLATSANNAAIIGASGSMGQLQLVSGSKGTIGSNLHIAASAVTGSSGSVSVSTDSTLSVAGDINMTTGTNTSQTAFLFVDTGGAMTTDGNFNIGTGTSTGQLAFFSVASGSSFNQQGAGTIDIGGAAAAGNSARLDVNGGSFTSGTGQISVHETGVLGVAGGSFTANGPVVLDSNSSFVLETGDFEAKTGLDNSAGGTIDHRDGTLTVSGGHFQATADIIGNEEYTISGAAAGNRPKLQLTSGATADVTLALNIGAGGTDGDMRIEGGAQLTHTIARLATNAGSDVDVVVTGSGSLWRAIRGFGFALFRVGGAGTAEVQVLDEAELYTGGGTLGQFAGGDGTVRVNNSMWTSTSDVEVGVAGTGLVDITQGSTVQIQRHLEIGTVNNGASHGDVLVRFGSTLTAIDAGIGGTADAAGGTGRLYVEDGLARFSGEVKIWAGGEMEIGAAGVFSSQPFVAAAEIDHTHSGTFLFNRGKLQVESFLGNLNNPAGTLAPGPDFSAGPGAGATAIAGNYTQGNDARLDIEVGGTIPGALHDIVQVSGTSNIDGWLDLTLLGSFEPGVDDEFIVLSATTLNGFFNNVFTGQRLRTTGDEGSFVVNYGVGSAFPANQIVLSDYLPFFSADREPDGDVDGADFLAIQRSNKSLIPAWQDQYGSGPAAIAGQHAVPEPASCVLLLLAALAAVWRQHADVVVATQR